MAWTDIARREHSRAGLRYPTDMTDREWVLAAPFIPPAKTGGRRRTTDMREVLNAMLYLASAGCAWRLLPKCFPPVSTVRRYFYRPIESFALPVVTSTHPQTLLGPAILGQGLLLDYRRQHHRRHHHGLSRPAYPQGRLQPLRMILPASAGQ